MTEKSASQHEIAKPPVAKDEEWATLAASLAAEKAARGETPPEREPDLSPPGVQRAVLSSSVALLLSFMAIVVAAMMWWQYRQFYVSLDETDAAAAVALERVRADQRALQDRLADTNEDIATLRQLDTRLGERLDALPGRFVALEERLDAVQGGSFDARGDLLRVEAEYYLTVANTELTLVGDVATAVTALGLADTRLAEIGAPELAPVREAIAGELLALRSLRLPDIEGVVLGLGRLAARADELPLRADLPLNLAERNAETLDAEPGFSRLWLAIKSTLLDLVRVEKRDTPVPEVLSAAERALSRRQFELEIELARIAALRGDEQAFRSGIDVAATILERDFDGDTGEVAGARALLREVRAFDIAPDLPDISRSLTLLRELRTGAR
jgi:uroporphyrin-III C-methyltransferase